MIQESRFHPDLGNGTYRNPVISQDIPDPTVLRDGDTYYYCGSTGYYYPALAIYMSKDLVNWAFVCHPCPNYTGNVYAPELTKYNGKYYLYFPADGTNFVTVSDRIDSGWCDPVDLKIGHIDPGHCVVNGKRYLFVSGNWAAPLSDDGMSAAGPLEKICGAQALPDDWDIEGPYTESPKLVQKGEWYYLIYADGGTAGPATAHAVMCARAKDPIQGPWEFSPYNPMVHTWSRREKWHCKGHGSMVDDVCGNWWILYHAYEAGYLNQGRKVLLEPVIFTEDGWPVLAGSGSDAVSSEAVLPKPAGVDIGIRDSLSDRFENGRSPLWQMRGSCDFSRIHAGGGCLTIGAFPADNPGRCHPITVCPADHAYAVQVTLEKPDEGCEAGVILMYDESHYAALGWKENRITIYRLGSPLYGQSVPQDAKTLTIRMRNDRHYVAFSVGVNGGELHKINYVQNVEAMSNIAYGGFSSLRAGLFACGKGEAHFGPFLYEALEDSE